MNIPLALAQTTAAFGHGATPARAVAALSSAGSCESEDGIASLDGIGFSRRLRRGQELFAEGDPAGSYYRVVSGAVRLLRLLPDGRRYVVDFSVAGDYFGVAAVHGYPYSAEAVIDTVVLAYSRRGVDDLIRHQPAVGSRFLELMSRELTAACDQQLLLGRKTAPERLASFLMHLVQRSGQAAAPRPELDLYMARIDIADHLGLTMETVSRGLNQLKRAGIIALPSPSRVLVLRLAALRRLHEGADE